VKFPIEVNERSNEGAKKPHCNVVGQSFFVAKCMMAAEAWLCSIRRVEEELDEA
jgi:hypothetical protein